MTTTTTVHVHHAEAADAVQTPYVLEASRVDDERGVRRPFAGIFETNDADAIAKGADMVRVLAAQGATAGYRDFRVVRALAGLEVSA